MENYRQATVFPLQTVNTSACLFDYPIPLLCKHFISESSDALKSANSEVAKKSMVGFSHDLKCDHYTTTNVMK